LSDDTRFLVAWALILLAVGDILISGTAITLARRHPNPALIDRAATSLLETIAATSLAGLSAAFIIGYVLAPGLVSVLFVGALILISVPNYVWFTQWLFGRFR
jgi:hypothetical protein